MSLETRARTAAEGLQEATTIDPEAGLDRLRRTHRRRRASRLAGAGVAAAILVYLVGPNLTVDRHHAAPAPAGSPSSTVSPPPSSPIDTTSWTTYKSDHYGFTVGHPPHWSEIRATRSWSFAKDGPDVGGPGRDSFVAPNQQVAVSVWKIPLDAGTPLNTVRQREAWVEKYCTRTGDAPCSGIPDRAVQLCLEARDCHPGLLVPFGYDVLAFFTGGIYGSDAMTIVAIWRGESDPTVARYGGSQRLLEAFLSTMQVWPASTPFVDRTCYGHSPAGPECAATH